MTTPSHVDKDQKSEAAPKPSQARSQAQGKTRPQAKRPAPRKNSKARRLVRHGWLSDQHGAWPIAIVPLLFGLIIGAGLPAACPALPGVQPQDLTTYGQIAKNISATAIVIGWMAAFLDFSALTMWLKSHRRPRYHKAIVTYGAIAFASVITVLALTPRFIVWGLLFGPFFAVTALLTWNGWERAFVTRVCSIVASLLMVPALADVVSGRVLSTCRSWDAAYMLDQPGVWMITAGLAAYYISSVPYVKTMIRQRGSAFWLAFSIALHAVVLAITVWGWAQGLFSIVSVFIWIVLFARTIVMPWLAHRKGRQLHPRQIGRPEVVYSIFVIIGLILSIP